jgi:predicted Zn-dependent protease with MMP-like domain
MQRTPPTLADIATLAEQALDAIPARFKEHAKPLALLVEDIADDETLDAMGIESGYDLTGLYRGVPLTMGRDDSVPREPDMIVLYREPILLEWIETGEDLGDLINNVLVHEVAHHFGFSDADIDALERGE